MMYWSMVIKVLNVNCLIKMCYTMSLETIIILSAILELITLICFFVLCANVSSIKKKLRNNGATPSFAFSMYLGMGEKEKAKNVLIEMILADEIIQRAIIDNVGDLKSVMGKYEPMLKEVDLVFDAEKAFNSKKRYMI